MAVEITKAGFPPGRRKMKGRCYNCGCEVVCEQDDAREELGDRPFDSRNWLVHCPTDGCDAAICVEYIDKK